MKNIILLNKKEGETPLQALNRFRKNKKEYENITMTYAGRLDPMASGLLLVLAGEEVHKKEKYLALGKEYDFQVLFGFATDTYDILGKIRHSEILKNIGMSWSGQNLAKEIKKNLKYFKGKFIQEYPMYSSRTVKGKPLFDYARRDEKVEIPEREVKVSRLSLGKIQKISSKKLLENIEKRIMKIEGDFRQEEILKSWRKELTVVKKSSNKEAYFFLADFKIKCGSGTYVRGIADSLGQRIGVPALAYSIKRTKIGKWGKI